MIIYFIFLYEWKITIKYLEKNLVVKMHILDGLDFEM